MASVECEPLTGGLGQSPHWGPGEEPWSRSEGAEAESILSFRSADDAHICPFLLSCKLLKYAS